jgi:hypothetical protein
MSCAGCGTAPCMTTAGSSLAKLTATLPPYALTYHPSEIKGLAKFFYQAGVPGAGASYYGPQYPAEP